jgi:hypothetical protein
MRPTTVPILGLVLATLLSESLAGPTLVSGIIDGEVWTQDGSPYRVTGDVLVSSLVVEAGVRHRIPR